MPFSNYEPEVIDVTDMEEEVAIFQNVHVVDFDRISSQFQVIRTTRMMKVHFPSTKQKF